MDIRYESKFKKDCKRAASQGLNIKLLDNIINTIAAGQKLPEKYRDHKLNDDRQYKNCRECHINPNWLLVYRINRSQLVLECVRLGSHSELFGEYELDDYYESVNDNELVWL